MAVLFQTTVGELAVDLFAEDAPYSAYNFLKLCKAKYYNNVAFHRVEKNFLASVGAPLTADARWNVAGLGGVCADFMTLGKSKNLVESGKTDAEDIQLRGGCSFWGVQTLAADGIVTLRRPLTRRPPSSHSSPSLDAPKVKTEDEVPENKNCSCIEGNSASPSSSSASHGPSTASCSPTSPSRSMVSREHPPLPPTPPLSKSGSADTSVSVSSSSSTSLTAAKSSSSFSSSSATNSSASAPTSSVRRETFSSQRRKKSGWDPVESPAASASTSSQQVFSSYFSSVDFSSFSFPPFPSNPLPPAPSLERLPPLRTSSSARFCPAEPSAANDSRRKHRAKGMVGWIPSGKQHLCSGLLQEQLAGEQQRRLHGESTSLFYITLRENIDFLDKRNLTLFGCVTEGLDVLEKINQTFVDERFVPLTPVRILHTYVLDDPFEDPPLLLPPPESPLPLVEEILSDDEDVGQDEVLLLEKVEKKEAEARKVTLEILGDLPTADAKPPDNVLFVAQLNPVTEDDDLRTVFSRFGEILSCDVIRDWKTKQSLQYAFIAFAEKSACELAYFKMQNVLIDDRRIHVDFSQSVAKTWHQYRQCGRFQQQQQQEPQGQQQQYHQQQQVRGKSSGPAPDTASRSHDVHAEVKRAAAAAATAAAAAVGKNAGLPQGRDGRSAQQQQRQDQMDQQQQQQRYSDDKKRRRSDTAASQDRRVNAALSACSGLERSNLSREKSRSREEHAPGERHVCRDTSREKESASSTRGEWRNSSLRREGREEAGGSRAAANRRGVIEAGRRRASSSSSSSSVSSSSSSTSRSSSRGRSSSRSRSKGTRKRKRGNSSSSSSSHKAERRRWKKKKRERSSSSSSEDDNYSGRPQIRDRDKRTKEHSKKMRRKMDKTWLKKKKH